MIDTEISNSARATDPLSSHLAALNKSNDFWKKVLEDLEANGPSDVWEISVRLGEKETAVSPVMRPMQRKNLIHEEGWHRSKETGERRILWAAGPSDGKHNPMPQRQTGPRPKFKPFTEEEIVKLGAQAGKYADIFTTLLNLAIEERLR